jgi:ABC-type protease/lipase transport system fused ATPase/permease subunit
MRRERPELIGSVRQVRTAVVWAAAFSAGAAVAGVGLPFLIIHAVDAALRVSSLASFSWIAAFAAVALLAKEVLHGASRQILLRASLWSAHSLGADALTHGLNAVRTPNALSHDRTALDQIGRCLQTLSPILDAVAVIIPVLVLVSLAPGLGLITLLALGGIAGLGLYGASGLRAAVVTVDAKRAEADHAWRTAAASSVVIAARGMTAGVVNDWQGLNGRAVAQAYQLGRRIERLSQATRLIQLISTVAVVAVGAALVRAEQISLGVSMAVLVLHQVSLSAVARGLATLPELFLAQHHLATTLAYPAASFPSAPPVAASDGVAAATAPVAVHAAGPVSSDRPHRRAEAS